LSLKVNEIFYSIQGESSYTGYPCIFVRLSGCNLRCSYCDTQYAYEDGGQLEIAEIVNSVKAYDCPLVEITGGEPLIQAETPILITQLIENGYKVLLETNGSQDISLVDGRCIRIVDIKCPSSGEHLRNDLGNLARLTGSDEVKFVIETREDFEYAKDVLKRLPSVMDGHILVHFSPVFGQIDPRQLAEWILEDHLNVRLHLQMHKVIWDEDARGV
jgi:7-carboxy-7-deazaguanine synthase